MSITTYFHPVYLSQFIIANFTSYKLFFAIYLTVISIDLWKKKKSRKIKIEKVGKIRTRFLTSNLWTGNLSRGDKLNIIDTRPLTFSIIRAKNMYLYSSGSILQVHTSFIITMIGPIFRVEYLTS